MKRNTPSSLTDSTNSSEQLPSAEAESSPPPNLNNSPKQVPPPKTDPSATLLISALIFFLVLIIVLLFYVLIHLYRSKMTIKDLKAEINLINSEKANPPLKEQHKENETKKENERKVDYNELLVLVREAGLERLKSPVAPEEEEWQRIVKYLKAAYLGGDTIASWAYAWYLNLGRGCDSDRPKALQILKNLMDKGVTEAAYLYCYCHINSVELAKIVKEMADSGYAPAMYEYGRKLINGEDAPKNVEEGAKLMIKAGEDETYKYIVVYLADRFRTGSPGFPVDLKEAQKYREIARKRKSTLLENVTRWGL